MYTVFDRTLSRSASLIRQLPINPVSTNFLGEIAKKKIVEQCLNMSICVCYMEYFITFTVPTLEENFNHIDTSYNKLNACNLIETSR